MKLNENSSNLPRCCPAACLATWLILAMLPPVAMAEVRTLDAAMHHLRRGSEREWSDFPAEAESESLTIRFQAEPNPREFALRLRQQDVKQTWEVRLNGQRLERLERDENDMVVVWPVPAGRLVAGENLLEILTSSDRSDDIRVGQVFLYDRPRGEVLSQATLDISVTNDKDEAIPCRITIADEAGTLVEVGAESDQRLAVRTGTIFTADGQARFGVMPGTYTIYAGRGPEYSLAKTEITIEAGQTQKRRLQIRRVVETPGYVRCDTHVHTLTYSRHGDASIDERMITIAAEALELPIATDHNVHIDYEPFARRQQLRQYFTPVIGNEVTTRVGHFNVFPIQPGASPPDVRPTDWATIFRNIFATPDVKVVILNHARDIHSGFRPFGPEHHLALVGENVDGWQLRANAMEVLNSAASQTDPLRLFHDWFGMLNAGKFLTPIGSSDSHDVARHFVAQGSTYIECPDDDPGQIDVDLACRNLLAGRVMVSMGLFTELQVADRYGPGDVAPVEGDEVSVAIRVQGPEWVTANHVALYANGRMIREQAIEPSDRAKSNSAVQWEGTWKLPRPHHDVHLVAIATGPGVSGPYWRVPKAYQPTSPVWKPYVIGATGAVWLDVDADGQRTAAVQYARRLVADAGGDLNALMRLLKPYDVAVAAQAVHLMWLNGTSPVDPLMIEAAKQSGPATVAGFRQYLQAWKESQQARGQ